MVPSGSGEGSGKTGSEALARLVRRRREELGMSRHDLAEATGFPYPTVAQIETAYRGVSSSRIPLLAQALGIEATELFQALASDAAEAVGGASSRSARTQPRAARSAARFANPAFAASPSPRLSGRRRVEVVDEVVDLLSQLPAEDRLEALHQVQGRLLSDVVRDEVQRRLGEAGSS